MGDGRQNGTGPKILGRGRGMAKRSLDLIQAAYDFLLAAHPATIRGVSYKLFIMGIIASMATKETKRVSQLLTKAREKGMIPWEWIVDEHRAVEEVATWRNPEAYIEATRRDYRRDFWADQPHRVQVWSEKGTVRGVLAPIMEEYGVGWMPLGGFNSATKVMDAVRSADHDDRPLLVLYVGDWDPSGMCMSERDLPSRIERYGGHGITLERIALRSGDLEGLPSFPVATKNKDSRHDWFVEHYGTRCWELDAMDPRDLRDRVENEIRELIAWEAWERCERAQEAEQESLQMLLDQWAGPSES